MQAGLRTPMTMNNKLNILLVDDDTAVETAIRASLRRQHAPHELFVAHNGEEALNMLRGLDPVVPEEGRVILLDCQMPVMGGLAFLEEIRQDSELRRTPVVMMSSSEDPEDRNAAYDLGVCGFVAKPMTLEGFEQALATVERFFELLELPGR